MFKSRKMRWAGHVARMERQQRCMQCFGGENLRDIDLLEESDVDRRIILTDLQEVG
jgi:hypothetical protein